MQYETLTDLLNNEAAAYDYFYALSPEMQTSSSSAAISAICAS